MTHHPASLSSSEVSDVNQRFYDQLWADSRLVRPERFNTWDLISRLAETRDRRLEVGPGMRPRLPIRDTHFVDISPPALETLGQEGGITHAAPVSDLPLADDGFDLVSALDIIEHVEDDEAALAEISRVAAPDARVLLSTPLHPEFWTPFDDIVGHYRRYEPDRLMDLLDRHGLEIEQSAIFGMKPRSSRLNDLGMWFLDRHRPVAMKVYNRFLMPLGLRLQKPLKLHPGMVATDGVEEVFMVCRRRP
ncbi:class I SAM-dependent methyltransferase [Thioalkalivibrio sp. ALJ24]|uniref:class I SAM-dependent methyltransferase n=1 Tax=Thioalkalivibrio sp. ALJ24 TaxID=545276 RepID=UPI0003727EEE|nr:class I SAM-dependent methyltransferase [Thioalkalivibrio sp. ALJ24]